MGSTCSNTNSLIFGKLDLNGKILAPAGRIWTVVMLSSTFSKGQKINFAAILHSIRWQTNQQPLVFYSDSRKLSAYNIKLTSRFRGTITWPTDSIAEVSTFIILPKMTTDLLISTTVPVSI